MSSGMPFFEETDVTVLSNPARIEELLERVRTLLEQRATTDGNKSERQMVGLSVDSFVGTNITNMDPHLQFAVARKRIGMTTSVTASTNADEIAVLARVVNAQDWEDRSEVRIPTIVGVALGGEVIVTGRIPLSRIEAVRSDANVLSLKAARELKPALHASTQETGASASLLPASHLANGGQGVVVGIVDFGADFAHLNFRKPDKSTRLLAVWHQNGASVPGGPVAFGREYSAAEINAALNTSTPYQSLGYGPASDLPGRPPGTHGTHVMDIAAGNGMGSTVAGMAPQAELVFVEVSTNDIPWSGPNAVGKSFGDSARLLEACKYIFDKAGHKPCVINISLGTNGGPHDGSTLVELGLDSLLSQPNRAIVIAASNSFDDGIHAAGTVPQGGHIDLHWEVSAQNISADEFELWYAGADRFDLEIIAPDGTSLGRIQPGETLPLSNANQELVVFCSNRLDDSSNHDNMLGVFIQQKTASWNPAGTWTLRIHGMVVTNGEFHAWIERDDQSQSRFAPPHDNSHTLGSISCGQLTIAVGSYDAHKAARSISWFSSAGPTRDGRMKPEVSAPGHEVEAAHSRTLTGRTPKSGTSMAAPAVAGICALVLAESQNRGLTLTIQQLRAILEQSARRSPPAGNAWDSRYGHGRISASAAVQAVIDLATTGGGGPGPTATTTAKPTKRAAKSAVRSATATSKKSSAKKKKAT